MKAYWDSSAVIEACNSPVLRARLQRQRAHCRIVDNPDAHRSRAAIDQAVRFRLKRAVLAAYDAEGLIELRLPGCSSIA